MNYIFLSKMRLHVCLGSDFEVACDCIHALDHDLVSNQLGEWGDDLGHGVGKDVDDVADSEVGNCDLQRDRKFTVI